MEITMDENGPDRIIHLKGRLAIMGISDLEKLLLEALEAGAQRLIFDMANLEYVSSAGLRVFFVVLKKMNNDASRMIFAAPQPPVQEVFKIAHLDRHVKIVSTLAEATATPS